MANGPCRSGNLLFSFAALPISPRLPAPAAKVGRFTAGENSNRGPSCRAKNAGGNPASSIVGAGSPNPSGSKTTGTSPATAKTTGAHPGRGPAPGCGDQYSCPTPKNARGKPIAFASRKGTKPGERHRTGSRATSRNRTPAKGADLVAGTSQLEPIGGAIASFAK